MKKSFKVLIVVILVGLIIGGVWLFLGRNTTKQVVKVKVVDSIEGYSYKLHDNDTEVYKKNYSELKKVLENSTVDEEQYVTLISKLFIIDFFTLDNKITNDDIGGVDFVHKDALDNFKVKAKDTLYKYVESNVYGDRKQNLPVVSDISDVKVENMVVSFKDINDSKAYKVKISFDYKKDLGYTKEKTLIFVHENKVLSLIEMK